MKTDINLLILYISLGILCVGFISGVRLVNKNSSPNRISSIPSLLTAGGVFFTFLGIALGLISFNPDELNASISTLLSGLKLAFVSSIVGMGLSILFKIIWIPKHESNQSKITPADMQRVLLSQLSEFEKMNTKNESRHQDNQRVFSELVSEIRALNTVSSKGNSDSRENFIQLRDEIKQFATSVSSQTSQQVAKSLQNSIESFNQGLMGQFGSNFKRLDDSVVKMLKWQQEYMNQVDQLTSAFEYAVESVSATEHSLGIISTHTQSIPNAMAKLSGTTEDWNQQISELELRLSAFSSMRDQAIQAMPEIQQQLDELCKRVDKSILNTCESLEKGVLKASTELQEKALALSEKLVDASSGIGSDLSTASGQIESMTNHLEGSTKNIEVILKDSVIELGDAMNTLVNGTKEGSQAISKTLGKVNDGLMDKHREQLSMNHDLLMDVHERIDKKIEENMHQQMQSAIQVQKSIEKSLVSQSTVFQQNIQLELERVMNDLGKGLADITNEFSSIYKRLAQELDRVELVEELDKAS